MADMGYISSADQKSLGERYRTTAITVAAIGLSALILLLVPKIISVESSVVPTLNWPKVLSAATLFIALTVVLTRRFLLSRVMLATAARKGRDSVLGRLSMTALIGAALGELTGALGLVGYLMTGESFIWPVGVVALILIAYSFPRRGEWARALEMIAQGVDK